MRPGLALDGLLPLPTKLTWSFRPKPMSLVGILKLSHQVIWQLQKPSQFTIAHGDPGRDHHACLARGERGLLMPSGSNFKSHSVISRNDYPPRVWMAPNHWTDRPCPSGWAMGSTGARGFRYRCSRAARDRRASNSRSSRSSIGQYASPNRSISEATVRIERSMSCSV